MTSVAWMGYLMGDSFKISLQPIVYLYTSENILSSINYMHSVITKIIYSKSIIQNGLEIYR